MEAKVLDATCGSRMMWFDKKDNRAVFTDNRKEECVLCDGRTLTVDPDVIADFTALPFPDESFYLVVFDPPHLRKCGDSSWLKKKYGVLPESWETTLKKGFEECLRVLRPNGVLIFKWNEDQVKVGQVVKAIGHKPLFGHPTTRKGLTIWMTYLKPSEA